MSEASKLDKRLRKILVKHGLLSEDQAESAAEAAVSEGKAFAEYLAEKGLLSEFAIMGAMSVETGLPAIDVDKINFDDELAEVVAKEVALSYGVLPVSKLDNFLTLAVSDPFDLVRLDEVRMVAGAEIRPVISTPARIRGAIRKLYERGSAQMDELLQKTMAGEMELVKEADNLKDDDQAAIEAGDEKSPVVKFVNVLIVEAIRKRASDIHIEPLEKRVRIRFRIDGMLQDLHTVPKKAHTGMVSRIKVIASLDIAEKGRPQDGMFQMRVDKRKVDFRVSIIPITEGEKVVLRILDGSALVMTLDALGFESKSLEDFRWAISQPYGMILATGPSGCGKTTTLYSGLKEIHSIEDNVITVEDPVEYQMEGVNQVQVNTKAGMTFAAALRSILRQDPDKIMIGEIRDAETIEIALRAALTGHLVLSTVHTNDAAQAVTRIVNMGIDYFLIASTSLLFTSQRLARMLCIECKIPVKGKSMKEMLDMQFTPEQADVCTLYEANREGCPQCYKGYRGRIAVLEALKFTDEIKRAVVAGKNALHIKKIALHEGMVTLRRAGISKVMQGLTSLDELGRVTVAD